MKVVNAEQMRELDRRAIEEHGIPGAVLMVNAGRAVFEASRDRYGPVDGKSVLVFAGTGNNGGDGFVAARYLHEAGALVTVKICGDEERISTDARAHLNRVVSAGVEIGSECPAPEFKVDALLGTGARGAPRGVIANAIRELNALPGRTIAVDIPSGIDSDTGDAAGDAVRADVTVTFGYPKIGHFFGDGAECTGDLVANDIGFDWNSLRLETPYSWIRGNELAGLLSKRPRDAHKGLFGHLLVVGGSLGMSGAPTMAAKAALRSGAGLVTIAAPASAQSIIAGKIDEAMTVALPEVEGALTADSFMSIEKAAESATVICLGPGITQQQGVRDLVMRILRQIDKPIVLDADGLNALADSSNTIEGRKAPLVLTPHPGECGRLLKKDTKAIQDNRLASVQEVARKYKCVAVLKGANSLIADGSRERAEIPVAINTTGNAGMATGGSGDSLTGIIGALLGQNLDAFDAACLGVYIHGRSGDLAAEEVGEQSLIAGDIIRFLPRAFRELKGNA